MERAADMDIAEPGDDGGREGEREKWAKNRSRRHWYHISAQDGSKTRADGHGYVSKRAEKAKTGIAEREEKS